MTSPIHWQHYLWEQPHTLDPQRIEELERQWGIKLPREYKETVSKHQGMAPIPDCFRVSQGEDAICTLLTIDTHEEHEGYSISTVYSHWKPHLPAGVFPFALTVGGELLCFDYRAAAEEPSIVHVSTEARLTPIASSFQALLNGLYAR